MPSFRLPTLSAVSLPPLRGLVPFRRTATAPLKSATEPDIHWGPTLHAGSQTSHAAHKHQDSLSLGDIEDLDMFDIDSLAAKRSSCSYAPAYTSFNDADAQQEGTSTLFEFPSYPGPESPPPVQLPPNSPYVQSDSPLPEQPAYSDISLDSDNLTPDLHWLTEDDLRTKQASLFRAMRHAEINVEVASLHAQSVFAIEKSMFPSLNAGSSGDTNQPQASHLTFFRPFEFTEAMLELRDAKRNVEAIRLRLAAVDRQISEIEGETIESEGEDGFEAVSLH
jgi:hypothetical protein